MGKRRNFNIKHVSLTLDTQERTGTLHFRCLDVLNILMSGVPEIWSRQNSKGKFSTFMPLIFSKSRRRGTKPNKTHYHLISCRLRLPCPFGKQIYQNMKRKILKFFERPLGLCFFKNLFSSSFCNSRLQTDGENQGWNWASVKFQAARDSLPRKQMWLETRESHIHGPVPTRDGPPQSHPISEGHSAELGPNFLNESWCITSQEEVREAPLLHLTLRSVSEGDENADKARSFQQKWPQQRMIVPRNHHCHCLASRRTFRQTIFWEYPGCHKITLSQTSRERGMQTLGERRALLEQSWLLLLFVC